MQNCLFKSFQNNFPKLSKASKFERLKNMFKAFIQKTSKIFIPKSAQAVQNMQFEHEIKKYTVLLLKFGNYAKMNLTGTLFYF